MQSSAAWSRAFWELWEIHIFSTLKTQTPGQSQTNKGPQDLGENNQGPSRTEPLGGSVSASRSLFLFLWCSSPCILFPLCICVKELVCGCENQAMWPFLMAEKGEKEIGRLTASWPAARAFRTSSRFLFSTSVPLLLVTVTKLVKRFSHELLLAFFACSKAKCTPLNL